MSDAEKGFISNANISMLAQTKTAIQDVGQRYGIAGTQALEFYEAVYNGKYKIKEGQTNLQAYQGYLSRLSLSFKNIGSMAKNFFGNLGANVLNMLGGMAAGAIVSVIGTGISWVYKQISGKAAEEAKKAIQEAGEAAQEKIASIKKETEDLRSSTSEVVDEFAKLAQGVGDIGKVSQNQGTLSTDEYARFVELSEKLVELYPSLNGGIDNNGEQLTNLSGSVDTITTSLNNLLTTEEKLANKKIADSMGDVWKLYLQNMEDVNTSLDSATQKYNEQNEMLQNILNGSSFTKDYNAYGTFDGEEELINAIKEVIPDENDYEQVIGKSIGATNSRSFDFSSLTEEQRNAIANIYGEVVSEYQLAADNAKADVRATNSDFVSYVNTWFFNVIFETL